MARRYQQGIGIPETLGTPLTTWKDPTPTPTKSFDMSVPNTGAQRNYGATGPYVDTVPHRWKVGEQSFKPNQVGQLIQSRAQDRASASELGISPGALRSARRADRATRARDASLSRDRALFDTTEADDLARSAADLGTTPETLATWRREDAETRRRERVLSRDRDIAMRRPPAGPALGGPAPTAFPSPTGTGTPPAGPPTGGTPAPPGFPAPSPATARTGRPVPPPPPSGGAPTAPAGTPSLDMPPMPPRRAEDAPWMTTEPDTSTAGDPFMEALRRAPLSSPDESEDGPDMSSPVEWRDDPAMPSLGIPGKAGDRALATWLRTGGEGSARTPASKPPASRTQRRPRRPNA